MIDNPYSRFKARSILWWAIIGFIVFTIDLVIVRNFIPFEDETYSKILLVSMYLCEAGWIYYISKKAGIDIRGLVRKGEGVKLYILFGLVLSLIIFSLGASILLGYLLSYTFPGLLTSGWFQEQPYPVPSSSPLLNWLLDTLALLVLAPIFEEIIFRGIFLNRWASKWNIRRALLLSAFFFAILHLGGFVGAFVFGLCMSLLYLKSRTLFIPIIAHFLTNAISLVYNLFTTDGDGSTESAVAAYRSWVWLGIVCLAISLPPIFFFIRRNYPAKDVLPPHLIVAESGLFESVESANTTSTPYE